jgi:hypothetical protein
MKTTIPIIAILISVFISGCHKSSDDNGILNFNEIKNKIESANEGDTVKIPAGTCIIQSQINVNKNITIIGAGIDKTIFMAHDSTLGTLITLYGHSGNAPMRLNGITLDDQGGTGCLYLIGYMTHFRIDHCGIKNGGHGLATNLDAYGVIDHCYFYNNNLSIILLRDKDRSSWDNPSVHPIGTAEAIFVEDCEFVGDGKRMCAMDADQGSRYVFRYNKITTTENYTTVTAHGRWGKDPDGYRGTFSSEIYNNVYNATVNQCWYGFFIRSGRGVLFNNTITGDVGMPIAFGDYNSFSFIDPETSDYFGAVYPSPDQINNYYVWNNTYNGNLIKDGVPILYAPDLKYNRQNLKLNRDYFDAEMPGYTPYTYPHPLTKE